LTFPIAAKIASATILAGAGSQEAVVGADRPGRAEREAEAAEAGLAGALADLRGEREVAGDQQQDDRNGRAQPGRVEPLHGEAAERGAGGGGRDGGRQRGKVEVSRAPEREARRGDTEGALQLVGGDRLGRRHAGHQQRRQRQQAAAPGDGIDEAGTGRRRHEQTDDLQFHPIFLLAERLPQRSKRRIAPSPAFLARLGSRPLPKRGEVKMPVPHLAPVGERSGRRPG
jgi:hypothetical protein